MTTNEEYSKNVNELYNLNIFVLNLKDKCIETWMLIPQKASFSDTTTEMIEKRENLEEMVPTEKLKFKEGTKIDEIVFGMDCLVTVKTKGKDFIFRLFDVCYIIYASGEIFRMPPGTSVINGLSLTCIDDKGNPEAKALGEWQKLSHEEKAKKLNSALQRMDSVLKWMFRKDPDTIPDALIEFVPGKYLIKYEYELIELVYSFKRKMIESKQGIIDRLTEEIEKLMQSKNKNSMIWTKIGQLVEERNKLDKKLDFEKREELNAISEIKTTLSIVLNDSSDDKLGYNRTEKKWE